jgi:hypothetical protein
MMNALAEYAFDALGVRPVVEPGEGLAELHEELRARIERDVRAGLESAPDAPLFDERQEGRSEVVREIANPRQS